MLDLQSHLVEQMGLRVCLMLLSREPQTRQQQWSEIKQKSAAAPAVWLIDGIERLSLLQRWQLVRLKYQQQQPLRIVATCHNSLVGLPTWNHTSTDQQLLGELLQELIPNANKVLMIRAEQLFERYGGNLRLVFWQLFDEVSWLDAEAKLLSLRIDKD